MHDELRRRIDSAAERFDKARRALLRPGGGSKFSFPEHGELEGVASANFNADLSRVEDEVEGRIARAEEKLQVEEHSDPSGSLSAEELAEANARRAFVADEVSRHTAQGLEDRVKAVIASGDRAAMFLYAHHLRSKAQESSPPEPEQLGLGQLADALERSLDPAAAGRLEKVQDEIAELRKIQDYAYLRRNGAKDPVELYLNKAYGATKW